MARKRNPENRGLPARWRRYHGAYFYQVPPGLERQWGGKKQFRLGTSLAAAYKVWSEHVDADQKVTLVAQLAERYALEVMPQKKPATQVSDRKRLPRVVRFFGQATVQPNPRGVKPKHVYQYVSDCLHRLTAARREIELLSHMFTMAVQWGEIDKHPFKGQVRFDRQLTPKPTRRYVEDWEVIEALSLAPRRAHGSVLMCQAYIRLKLLTGLRQTDLLLLEPSKHFTATGIDLTAHKTEDTSGVRQLYEWTPQLRAAVDMALAARPLDIARWLFCTKAGGCYVNGDTVVTTFARIWNNFMHRAFKETKLTVRFKERALRSKVASDAETLERAQALLGHADARLTKQVYVLKPTPMQPARGIK